MKRLPTVKRIFLYSLIPVVAVIVSETSILEFFKASGYIGAKANIERIKYYFGLIIPLYSVLLLGIPLALRNASIEQLQTQSSKLLERQTEFFIASLRDQEIFDFDEKINIRIFLPEVRLNLKRPLYRIVFTIKNWASLAQKDTTEGLELEVYPETQGLVGKAYKTKRVQYDADLEKTNASDYGFNEVQVRRTSQLKFSMCAPVFNKRNKIKAIIAFDSNGRVQISDEGVMKDRIAQFSQDLFDSMPSLFR